MTDLFESKFIKPMLIGEMAEAFDSADYIYELKLDGERCIAYLDPKIGTDLRNKRNVKMLPKVPELSDIHKQVKCRCILDGELIVIKDGKPDFFEIQRRSLTSNSFKIYLHSAKLPASFIAFDILYYNDHKTHSLPLMERKKLLEELIQDNERLSVSRYTQIIYIRKVLHVSPARAYNIKFIYKSFYLGLLGDFINPPLGSVG